MTLSCINPVHDLTSSSLLIVLKHTLSPRQAHLLEPGYTHSCSQAVLRALLKHTALQLREITLAQDQGLKLHESVESEGRHLLPHLQAVLGHLHTQENCFDFTPIKCKFLLKRTT